MKLKASYYVNGKRYAVSSGVNTQAFLETFFPERLQKQLMKEYRAETLEGLFVKLKRLEDDMWSRLPEKLRLFTKQNTLSRRVRDIALLLFRVTKQDIKTAIVLDVPIVAAIRTRLQILESSKDNFS